MCKRFRLSTALLLLTGDCYAQSAAGESLQMRKQTLKVLGDYRK